MTLPDIEDLSGCGLEGTAERGSREDTEYAKKTYNLASAPDDRWNRVLKKVVIAENPLIVELKVFLPSIAASCCPGQFVIVRLKEGSERIPLTIADFDREEGWFTMVIQAVGRSSQIICHVEENMHIQDIVGPLGHPSEIEVFETEKSKAEGKQALVICVAGGVGVAPVHPIQRLLHETGNRVVSICGARNKDLVFWDDKMQKCCSEYVQCTDDGTAGFKGFVTQALDNIIQREGADMVARVIAIGPGPMMEAVTKVTRPYAIKTIVSLNALMLDGTGMCGACRVTIAGKTRFACVEGPEFDGHDVDWRGLAVRMKTYRTEEIKENTQPESKVKPHHSLEAAHTQVPMPQQDPRFRSTNFFEVALGYTLEMARAEARRCLQCPDPMCQKGCPVQVNIPKFIRLVRDGRIHKAFDVIKKTNPCPGITGRVCPQENQCQCADEKVRYGCVLGKMGRDPVAIGRLERFVADYCRANPRNEVLEPQKRDQDDEAEEEKRLSGCKVAIVGSGPAGVACAAEVEAAGHRVTIFEALHKAGGVLSYGIPSFRLPKDIVGGEIDALGKNGLVDVRLNCPVGPSGSVAELLENGYDAAFLGLGAGLPRFLGIPGEDLPGVYSANEFLTRVNFMRAFEFPFKSDTPIIAGNHVVVVGAGNVACDACRSVLRLGVRVTMVYRRDRASMPARAEEIEHALEEGVQMRLLSNPVEVVPNCENTHMKGIKIQRMELTATGRVKPVEPAQFEFIKCDTLVIAIGQGPNPVLTSRWPELETNRGLIKVDENQMTNIDRVYAGGDIVTGAATVIRACGAGRKAGLSINHMLAERGLGKDSRYCGMTVKEYQAIKASKKKAERAPSAEEVAKKVPKTEDVGEFRYHRIDTDGPALKVNINSCMGCGSCVEVCPMNVLEQNFVGDHPTLKDGKVKLSETDCISCGQCANVCPVRCVYPMNHTPVFDQAKNDGKICIALTAPASRVGLAEAFGASLSRADPAELEHLMVRNLRKVGFQYVFDIQAGADATIIEESKELLTRLHMPEPSTPLPLLTSCCPGHVTMVQKKHPKMVPNLSSCQSPMVMAAVLVKRFMEGKGYKPEQYSIFGIMPCTAKKVEIERDCVKAHVTISACMTVRETALMMRHFPGLDYTEDITEEEKAKSAHLFDSFLGTSSGAGAIFGATGGVMEAALRGAHYLLCKRAGCEHEGNSLPVDKNSLALDIIRSHSSPVKTATFVIGPHNRPTEVRVAVIHGAAHADAFYAKVENGEAEPVHFIETMACEHGCVGGGGMALRMRSSKYSIRTKRAVPLRKRDEHTKIPHSFANTAIVEAIRQQFNVVDITEEPVHALHLH
eukprot:GCRY01000624.1.p1 GENE.GCRY01000624.1~~GCRY01000624.1.p1  ORF type:complete len:1332 (+),score=494.53 GCRY01000624.1:196-4191(+)